MVKHSRRNRKHKKNSSRRNIKLKNPKHLRKRPTTFRKKQFNLRRSTLKKRQHGGAGESDTLKALNLHGTQHPDDTPRGALDGSLWTTENDPFKKGKISKKNYDNLKSRVDNHKRNADNPRIRNRFQRISNNMDRLEREHHDEVRRSTGFLGMGKKKLPTHLEGTTAPVDTTSGTLASFPPLDRSVASSTTPRRPAPARASSDVARATGAAPPPRDESGVPMTQIPGARQSTSSIQGHGVSEIHDDSEGTQRALGRSTDPSFDVVPSTNPTYTGPIPEDTGPIGLGAALSARVPPSSVPTSSSRGLDDDSIADLDISGPGDVVLPGPIGPDTAVSARDINLLPTPAPAPLPPGVSVDDGSSAPVSASDGRPPPPPVPASDGRPPPPPVPASDGRPPPPPGSASDGTSASGSDQVITINITAPPGTIANLGGNAELDRNNLAQVDVTLAQLVQSIA